MPTAPKPMSTLQRVTSISRSYPAASPIAQASLARDLEEASDSEAAGTEDDSEDESEASTLRPSTSAPTASYPSPGLYRRPSFAGAGNRATVVPYQSRDKDKLSKEERQRALEEERSLLRDNHLIPPKHPQTLKDARRQSIFGKHLTIPSIISGGDRKGSRDEETAPLLDGAERLGPEASP